MKRSVEATAIYSMYDGPVLQDGVPRRQYRAEFHYLQFFKTPYPKGLPNISASSVPVWDAQDVYDDAHGLIRLMDLEG